MGPRFSAALAYANELHGAQVRKGTRTPYIGHLLAVAAIVIEAGGDEDTAIAALLHDAMEDQGGRPTLERIRRRFGKRVAEIVEANSDAEVVPKPPWKERKLAYLAGIPSKSASARLVSLADKLHNVRSIAQAHRVVGRKVWARFSVPKARTLWYYRALRKAFKGRTPRLLWREYDAAVRELGRLA